MTMSYRLDSEMEVYYGATRDLSNGKIVAPAVNVVWKEPEYVKG
jgi:hypothetical protein